LFSAAKIGSSDAASYAMLWAMTTYKENTGSSTTTLVIAFAALQDTNNAYYHWSIIK
jgi:hypothetical protein